MGTGNSHGRDRLDEDPVVCETGIDSTRRLAAVGTGKRSLGTEGRETGTQMGSLGLG